jgi:DNA-binding transcriptional LysR family regulator
MRTMTLDQLRYFVAAATHEGVLAAARALHISPSAITHAIHALEDELAVELFERRKKRIYLTSRGRALMVRGQELLAQAERLKEVGSDAEPAFMGTLRLGSTQSLAVRSMVPALSELQRLHPSLRGELVTRPSAELLALALSQSIDFAIAYGPLSHPEIASEHLYEDPFEIVVRKGHPIHRAPASAAARARILSECPAAAPRIYRGVKNLEHPSLEALGIAQNVNFVFGSYDVAEARLAHTNEWAFMPSSLVRASRLLSAVKIPGWRAVERVIAIWSKARGLSAPSAALVREIERAQG